MFFFFFFQHFKAAFSFSSFFSLSRRETCNHTSRLGLFALRLARITKKEYRFTNREPTCRLRFFFFFLFLLINFQLQTNCIPAVRSRAKPQRVVSIEASAFFFFTGIIIWSSPRGTLVLPGLGQEQAAAVRPAKSLETFNVILCFTNKLGLTPDTHTSHKHYLCVPPFPPTTWRLVRDRRPSPDPREMERRKEEGVSLRLDAATRPRCFHQADTDPF